MIKDVIKFHSFQVENNNRKTLKITTNESKQRCLLTYQTVEIFPSLNKVLDQVWCLVPMIPALGG